LREVQFEFAPVNPAYANPIFHVQATGGSTSIRAFYSPLRQVGAVARALLCQAAAAKWGVPISECSAAYGRISHSSGQSENYGALADAAAKLPLPANVELKARGNWRILGKSTARLDTLPKVDGSAQFGIDVLVPEMLVGTIAACPVFGGKLEAVDDKPALAVKGVKAVVKLPDAVAVVGDGYWPCKKGLEALSPQWDEGPTQRSTASALLQHSTTVLVMRARSRRPMATRRQRCRRRRRRSRRSIRCRFWLTRLWNR
jgi:isoquinoline 1-oxidoreductase subunit beta